MPRYVAFLRGVSPLNAKMVDLKRAFEAAGFSNVKTVLSSGNVAFDSPSRLETKLARQAEAAMAQHLDRTFYTIVRRQSFLHELIEADPYASFDLPANVKRIVTFVGEPPVVKIALPIQARGMFILAMYQGVILGAYMPDPRGGGSLQLIEKMFGNQVTTRTWETVERCAKA